MNVIDIEKVYFRFYNDQPQGKFFLEDINLQIPEGKFVSILGPNGSGKTTLLRLISGFLSPSKGSVSILHKNVHDYKRNEIAKKLSFVSQINEAIFPYSVFQFVSMGRNPYSSNSFFVNKNDILIIQKYMELFELSALREKRINEISGGELQRAYLCRALVQEPKILLMDEPVSHLDIKHQLSSYKLLKEINKELGITIILVSHDINLSLRYSDRLIFMKQGRIIFNSKPEDISDSDLINETFGVNSEMLKNRNDKIYFFLGD